MGYLEFEVVPEVALKNDLVELMLGMPLNQAIAMLQNAARHIRNIELTYCQKVPRAFACPGISIYRSRYLVTFASRSRRTVFVSCLIRALSDSR